MIDPAPPPTAVPGRVAGAMPWRPVLAAGALFLGLGAWLALRSAARNGGQWVYPLDDTYIHMATVKHLVRHGVLGISYLDGFSSCLSSLLYPALLAVAYLLGGVNQYAPLVLNALAGGLLLGYAGAILRRYTRSDVFIFGVLAAAVLLTPLTVVAITGMEHTWQILVDLFFVDVLTRVLSGQPRQRRSLTEVGMPLRGAPKLSGPDTPSGTTAPRQGRQFGSASERHPYLDLDSLLPLAAFLAVTIRFEGLFLVAIAGLLLLCRGRFWLAVAVGAGAALPLALFGAFSVSKGWAFLPNSVLLKGGRHLEGLLLVVPVGLVFAALRWRRFAWRAALAAAGFLLAASLIPKTRGSLLHLWDRLEDPLEKHGHMALLLCALAAALYWSIARRRTLWTPTALFLGALLATALQHVAFARLGWFYRYEAYLLFLGILGVGMAVAEAWPGLLARPRRLAVGGLAAAVASVPLVLRSLEAHALVPQASHDIYAQQYQMGRFVARFYDGAGVAANDIGAINYFADLRLIDTWGLADRDVFKDRRRGAYTQDTLRRLIARRGIQLVMVYDAWTPEYGGPLPEWVPVGRWTHAGNVVCASDTVSFYAPDASLAPRLTAALQAFAGELPPDVAQAGAYRGGPAPHVVGGYPPDFGPDGQPFYWTPRVARFALDPLAGRPAGGAPDRLDLGILPTPGLRSLEIKLNGQEIGRVASVPGAADGWMTVSFPARWRAGENTLEIDGRGDPLPPAAMDERHLFGVREPAWQPANPLPTAGVDTP